MKKKLILLSTSLIYISPISIISCTNSSLYDQSSVNAQQVFTNVQSGQIQASIDNNIKINILDELGERRLGISSWSEKPKDFERRQFSDEKYKIGDGENKKEV